MKIVCFGDFHAHLFNEFAEFDEITGNSRFTFQLNTLDSIKKYCLENEVDTILFSGDLFHKRVTVNTIVYNQVRDKIKELGESNISLFMLVGNHDQVDNSDFPQHSLHSFKELQNVTVLDKFEEVLHKDVVIYPLPYTKNKELVISSINKYEKSKNKSGKKSIVLAHLGVSGAFVGKGNYAMADSFVLGDFKPNVFDFGVFGHFHKRQFLDKNNRFFYTGAPIQHSFNDEGEDKGLYEIDTNKMTVKFVPIDNPKFITITDFKNKNMEDLVGNYIRFQCDTSEVETLSEIIPKNLQHRVEPQKMYKEEKRVDIDVAMSLEEVVAVYADKFNPDVKELGLEIVREMKTTI